MKITDEQWSKALDHAQEMMNMAQGLPNNTGMFYVVGCRDMIRRFLNGERTNKLYKEMIELN